MAAGLTMPTISVQMSMTDPYATPDFVDVTAFCQGIQTQRGRQHELNRFNAGTCNLTMWNPDGRFTTFNPNSLYINQLSGADSFFQDESMGQWGNTTNCALVLQPGLGLDSTPVLQMGSSAAGTMTTQTSGGVLAYPVTASTVYSAIASVKTAVSARTCTLALHWYTAAGASISNTSGTGVADATGSWTKITVSGASPSNAAFVAVLVQVASTGGSNELHYVQRIGLFHSDQWGGICTTWGPGGRGNLSPARTVKVLATWPVSGGTQYPVFSGFVTSWVPAYSTVFSTQVIQCADAMSLLALPYLTSSAYPGQVIADGAVDYWRLGEPVFVNSTFLDQLPSGHSLIGVNGQFTIGVAGALTFDTNAAVGIAVPNGTAVQGTFSAAAFSAEFWMQTTATVQMAVCVDGPLPAQGIGVSGGFLTVGLTTTSAIVNDGNWHHIVLTWVYSTGVYIVYCDGVSVNTATGTTSRTPQGMGFGPLAISAATVNYDEIAIYDSQLSASAVANHHTLGIDGYVVQQSGSRIAAVLSSAGVPSGSTAIATGISAVQAPTSTLDQQQALSYIQTVEATEQGQFFVDESGVPTFYDRHHIITASQCITSNCTLANDNNVSHFPYLDGSIVPSFDVIDLWNDIPTSATTNAGLGVTGDTQNIAGTIGGVSVSDVQSFYGRRSLTGYTSLLQTTDTEAATLGQWLFSRYGTPLTRVRSIAMDNTANAGGNFPQMLGRKLLDAVTVTWQPLDGSAEPLTQVSLIESISHSITKESWTTTWQLAPAEATPYMILGDAVRGIIGTTNRLGY